jgi:hypothetical protein
MTMVNDYNDKPINFEAAVNLMDDDIREEIAATHEFDDNPQGFLEEYAKRHGLFKMARPRARSAAPPSTPSPSRASTKTSSAPIFSSRKACWPASRAPCIAPKTS